VTCRRAASCWAAPRAHHAQRRRPAARRRPQPHPGQHHPQLRELRPHLRARSGGDHAPRLEAHGREAGKRLLLHHAAQRELRHARPHARHRRADHQGHVPVQARRRATATSARACSCWARAPSCASPSPRRSCWPPTGACQADVWSCPSFNELGREGQDAERWNLLHPLESPARALRGAAAGHQHRPGGGLHRLHEGLRRADPPFIPKGRTYKVLGTDGFGRSDFRSKLREHFEVNRHYIVVAALKALSEDGTCARHQGGGGHCQVRHQGRQDQPAVRLTEPETTMALVEIQVPDIGDFDEVA
jgi:hypothetical protein